jgi:hypothetical protein
MNPTPLAVRRVDLRALLAGAKDQGPRSTCLAFAVTAAHELARFTGAGGHLDFSEEVLHWKARQLSGAYQAGVAFDAIATAISTIGQPREEFWPYEPFRNESDPSYQPPPDAIQIFECVTGVIQPVPSITDRIRAEVSASRPVVLGIGLSTEFAGSIDGVVELPKDPTDFRDNHAVLVVGFDDDSRLGDFIFRNSWGEGWGENGHGFLPYDYLRASPVVEAWVFSTK